MQSKLSGKTIVITGAARGIGEALARAVLREGGRLAALDLRWDEDSPFFAELRQHDDALALSCDIENEGQITHALRATLERFGAPHVLVNNAAMRQRDFFPADGACAVLDTTDRQWQRMFEVNVIGQLRITRAFVRPMMENGRGHVINISAKGGVNYPLQEGAWSMGPHLRLNQPYDASKAAFTNMSFYLAEELREHGVAVNVVFPGAIRSTGVDEMEQGRRRRGLQMQLHEPDSVVPVLLHLAGLDGTEVTGKAFSAITWNSMHAAADTVAAV